MHNTPYQKRQVRRPPLPTSCQTCAHKSGVGRCPEMCRDCAMSGFCYVCYDPYDGPYCEIKAEFRTSEGNQHCPLDQSDWMYRVLWIWLCGMLYLGRCRSDRVWQTYGWDRICRSMQTATRTHRSPWYSQTVIAWCAWRCVDDHDAENYIRERPQGPMVALFMLFFLFVISVTIRENCRRRDRQNRLQDDAHVAPPMTQATHSPDASNPPSNIKYTSV